MSVKPSIIGVARLTDGRLIAAATDRKPGRTIHGICSSEGRVFIVGAKNLVLELRGETLVELGARATFADRELLFRSAVLSKNRLWLSTFGALVSLDGAGAQSFDDIPVELIRGFGLACHRSELLLYHDEVLLGQPGNWRPFFHDFRAEGLIAVEPLSDDRWCAISYAGQSYLLDGDSIEHASIV